MCEKIYVLESKLTNSDHHRMRSLAILNAINRAILATQEHVPNIEFSFSIADVADPSHQKRSIWALSRRNEDEEKWVMSDWAYWSWPLDMIGEYSYVRDQIKQTEKSWDSKIPKLVWRGAASTNNLRNDLLKVTQGKTWADVKGIFWKSATNLKAGSLGAALSMPQHCDYQFVMQTEGKPILATPLCFRPTNLFRRNKLLWSRQIPPKLPLRVRSPQARMGRTTSCSIRVIRAKPKLRRSGTRFLRLGRQSRQTDSKPRVCEKNCG
jgi:hypothetical protein